TAEFTNESFGDSDITLFGSDRRGDKTKCLVGPSPKLRFWNDRLVIVASEESNSTFRNVSVLIGDAVKSAAQAGDRLYIIRTGCGGIGLSVLRREELILAIGAIAEVPLGNEIKVTWHPLRASWNDFVTDTWLELRVQSHSITLRERETAEIEDYCIYVERKWEPGTPGTDGYVSICRAVDSRMRVAAMRSVVLLGQRGMKLVSWDCSEYII